MTKYQPSITDLRGLLDDPLISSMDVFKSYFLRLFTKYFANSPYEIENWYLDFLENGEFPIEERLLIFISNLLY